MKSTDTLLDVRDLRTHFRVGGGAVDRLLSKEGAVVRAVDGISLSLRRGEIVGLVGESGSGKTTFGETILRLVPATSGEIDFDGTDVLALRRSELRRVRRRMQMIFQDPHASLSPRIRIDYALTEPYAINDVPSSERSSVADLLETVELGPEHARKYPHELSGGQARRVGIARALALRPELLIADEPTSGLDVSAAASVINLFKDLNDRFTLTCLLITHNLNLVGHIADRIAVMYLGQLVEVGPADRIFEQPLHPYTRALIAAVPEPDPYRRRGRRGLTLSGEIPSPKSPPKGCRFNTRCAYALADLCGRVPPLEEVAPGHFVACHRWRDVRDETGRAR